MVLEWNDRNSCRGVNKWTYGVQMLCVCVNYNLYYVGICFSSAFFLFFNKFFCNYLFKIASYVKTFFLNLGTDVLTCPVRHEKDDSPHKPCALLVGGRTENEFVYITTCQAHTLIKMLHRTYKDINVFFDVISTVHRR